VEGKRKGNKALGRCRHRREGAIKMDLKEIGLEGLVYDLAQGMDKWWAVVNKRPGFIKCCEFLG
jgi:hypothetical protein